MLKKLPIIIAFAGAALNATAAQALSIYFHQGNAATNLMDTHIIEDFDNLAIDSMNGGGAAVKGPQQAASGTTPAFGSSGNFLSLQTNASSTLLLPNVQVVSFVIGSLDTYNRVDLNFLSGAVVTLYGNQIIDTFGTAFNPAEPSVTDRTTLPAYNGRVFFDAQGLDYITAVSFASINNSAFEIDNISVAAPEPATWGMMILAAGMAGAALRHRRTGQSIA